MQDRRVTVRELVEEVGITMQQKQLRLEVSQDMLDYANSDPEFRNIVITGDESWVYGYDPETKVQLSVATFNIPEAKNGHASAD